MAFIDYRVLQNGKIIFKTKGGPSFKTIVVQVNSGAENRNQAWEYPLGEWDFGDRNLPDDELTEVIDGLYAVGGMANGFRFKDYGDYRVTAAQGVMGADALGTGYPTYQCQKNYVVAGSIGKRLIYKFVAGTFVGYRNTTPLVVGSSAGNIAVNINTGIVTFVADASSAASAITVGSTTQVTLAANPNSLGIGKYLYLSGFTGTDAALVNGQSAQITNVTGAGPYVFTLALNTATKTITVGSGHGYAYPQPSDTLTFSAEFDIPVRFDTDKLTYTPIGADMVSFGVTGEIYFYLEPTKIIEIRDIV